MIKWLSKPHKKYQIQAEGYFLGRYFYFRSKFNASVIEFSNHKNHYDYHLEKSYLLHVNNDYEAEYLNLNFCKLLIVTPQYIFCMHYRF